MIKCKDCAFWEARSNARGRCHYDPPSATLIPAQGLSGQGLSVESLFLMNSLYGKFGSDPENYKSYMVAPKSDFNDLLENEVKND